jgi:hypothetical protein
LQQSEEFSNFADSLFCFKEEVDIVIRHTNSAKSIHFMKLPNGAQAEISMEKLIGYCLNPNHPKGKDKARVFKSALAITAENAERLYDLVKQAAIEGEVVQQSNTSFGKIFKVDWIIPGTENIQLRTTWEIAAQSTYPRLISAFIKN